MMFALSLWGCGAAGAARYRVPAPAPSEPSHLADLERRVEREGVTAALLADLAASRLAAGHPAAASREAARALVRDPQHVGALVIAARGAAAQHEPEVALRRYETAVEYAPAVATKLAAEWFDVVLAVAQARLEAGRPHQALQVLSRFRGRHPRGLATAGSRKLTGLVVTIAERLVSQGQGVAALEVLEILGGGAARRRAQEDIGYWEGCARALSEDGEAAWLQLERWAGKRRTAERWTRVGAFYLAQRDHERAQAAYGHATRAPAAPSHAWTGLAEAAIGRGAADDAVELFGEAARRTLDPAARLAAWLHGAHALVQAGRHAQALPLFEAASLLAPADGEIVHSYAEVLGHLGRHETLEVLATRHVDATAEDASAVMRTVKILVDAAAMDGARRVLHHAANHPRAEASLWLELARLYGRTRHGTQERDEAIASYLSASGDAPIARVRVGHLRLGLRQLNRAEALARSALASEPDLMEAHLLLADIGRISRRREAEASAVRAALQAGGDSTRRATGVAERHLRLGEIEQAVALLAQIGKVDEPGLHARLHHIRFMVQLAKRPVDGAQVSHHMRAWLEAVPDNRRVAALEELLDRTMGNHQLGAVRVDVLRLLIHERPADATLTDALARLLLDGGDPAAAAAAWWRHLRHAPDVPAATIRIGRALLDKGHVDAALGFFDQLVPAQIDDLRLHRLLGRLTLRRGDVPRAQEHFARFVAMADGRTNRHEIRLFAREMMAATRHELAADAFEKLLAGQEDDREAMLGLGQARLGQGNRKGAQRWLELYVETASGARKRQAYQKVGDAYETAGWLSKAGEAYERWLEEERPGWTTNSFHKLAGVYRRLGDRDGLMRVSRVLVSRSRHPVRATLLAVRALEDAGQEKHAATLLDEALGQRRGDRSLLEAAARNALLRGDVPAAESRLLAWVKLRGGTGQAWSSAAEILQHAGQTDRALALLSQASGPAEADAPVHLARGRIRLAQGDLDGAEESFDEALAQATTPRDVVASVDAAWTKAAQASRLRRFHRRAAARASSRAEHPLALGRLLLARGRLDDARGELERYLSLHERGHLQVARAFAGAGYVDDAMLHFGRALEQPAPGDQGFPLDEVTALLVGHGRAGEVPYFAQRFLHHARDPRQGAVEVADAFRNAGDLRQAISWIDRADAIEPRPEHDLARGRLLVLAGSQEEARRALARYVDRKVLTVQSARRIQRGDRRRAIQQATQEVVGFLVERSRHRDALALVEDVRAAHGEDVWLRLVAARLQVLGGEVDAALSTLDMAHGDVGRGHHDAVLALVMALQSRDRQDAAARVLRWMLSAQWHGDLALMRLRLLARRGRWFEARAQIRETLATGGVATATDMARISFEEGLDEEARRLAVLSLEHGPPEGHGDARRLLAALDAGRTLPSGPDEQESLEGTAPGDALARWKIDADLALEQGDAPRAYDAALRVLGREPGDRDRLRIAVLAAAVQGDEAQLEAALALVRSPSRSRLAVLEEVVGWLEGSGFAAEALRMQRQVIAMDGGYPARWLTAIRLALAAGQDVAARSLAEDLLSSWGDEPTVRLDLASLWASWLAWDTAAWLVEGIDDVRGPVGTRKHLHLARVMLAQADTKLAFEHVEKALEAAPDPMVVRIEAVGLLLEWGAQPSRIVALLAPLLAEDNPSPEVLALGARVAWQAGEAQRARTVYTRYVETYPSHLSALDDLLVAAVRSGDAEGTSQVAHDIVRRAGIEHARIYVAARVADVLGGVPHDVGGDDHQAMVEVVRKLIVAAASNPETTSQALTTSTATLHALLGQIPEAMNAYEAAILRRPSEPSHRNNLAYALAEADRDLPLALRLVRQASAGSIRPLASYLDTEAWILHRLGRSEEALPIMRWAMRWATDRAHATVESKVEMLYHLGAIQAANGLADEARTTWRDCARRAPTGGYGARCLEAWRASDM